MSLIKLIKKQLLYNTDESWSAFANLSFNGKGKKKKKRRGDKGREIKGRGEEHLNIENLTFWSQKRDSEG